MSNNLKISVNKKLDKLYNAYLMSGLGGAFKKKILFNKGGKLDKRTALGWEAIENYYKIGLIVSNGDVEGKALIRVIFSVITKLLEFNIKASTIKSLIADINGIDENYPFLEFYIWSTLVGQEVSFYIIDAHMYIMSDADFLEYRLVNNIRTYLNISLNEILDEIGLFDSMNIELEKSKIVSGFYGRYEEFFTLILGDAERKSVSLHRNRRGTSNVNSNVKIDPKNRLRKVAKRYTFQPDKSIGELKQQYPNSLICLKLSHKKISGIDVYNYEHLKTDG